jgi:eukaryotic-like serine/threonine-protein kinase
MKPERWRQIDEVFQGALECDPSERDAFLDQACGGDSALRSKVEALIASDAQAGRFIEDPAVELNAELIAHEDTLTMMERIIGPYTIESKLGSGGMGKVYLAQDVRLRRRIALKLLDSDSLGDSQMRARFLREARLASQLDHPNICTIHEVGENSGQLFIAMQYVEGETLKNLIGSGPLSLASQLSIGLQVASALAAAHALGIAHRDIKSSNIIVTSQGHAKVLDFGLAKLIEPGDHEVDLTRSGAIMGTPSYMSPEQALGKPADHRTDVFSFGVVLYEMATGRTPFKKKTSAETINAVINEAHPPVRQLNKEIPMQLAAAIDRALAKDPQDRYPAMQPLIADLREVALMTDSLRDPYSGPNFLDTVLAPRIPQRRTPLANRMRNLFAGTHRVFLASAAAIVLAIIGIIAYYATLSSRPEAESATPPGPPRVKSIAVLPFKPVVIDARDESLEMGLAETLITSLSNIRRIVVRPMSAVRKYGGLEQDPIAAGREQRVEAVVDGSIQKSADKIRVTVRLMNTADGQQVWADNFDQKIVDIFTLEDSISQQVANALAVRFSADEREMVTKRFTTDPEAYQLYLKGRYFWNKRTAEALNKSIEYFNEAIQKDPNYALAYVGLADAYAVLPGHSMVSQEETIPKAKAAAQKALDIDSQLPEAHTTLASLSADSWEWAEADRRFKRALELNPNYPTARQWYGEYLDHVGRSDEALQQFKVAQELDPTSVIVNSEMGQALYHSTRYDQAVDQLQKTLEMDPDFIVAHYELGLVYQQKNMDELARLEFEKALNLSGGATNFLALLGVAYKRVGNDTEAQKILDRLTELLKQKRAQPHDLAIIYTGFGDKKTAIDWLFKAYEKRSWLISLIRIDPFFDPLRSEDRFKDLLRRVGFPQ